MMPVPDYHMHTYLCRHALGEPVDYARRAVSVGLEEIGFTDHSPAREDGFDDWRMLASELPSYVAMVQEARERFPELKIRLGLEVDFIPGHEPWIQEMAAAYDWDYFIGSVHYLVEEAGKWDIDNPARLSMWREREPWDIWSAYAAHLRRAAESGLFDILGHADLCKKFAIYPKKDHRPLFGPVFDACAEKGMAIELNTAGLRKDCEEIYPSRDLLAMARERGVGITFGSDAHAAGEVGADFHQAVSLAKEVGYTHSIVFEKRAGRPVPLP